MKFILLLSIINLVVFKGWAQTVNQAPNTLVIHELYDPDGLNPLKSSAAVASYIQSNIFFKLLTYDPKTLALEPQLALTRPVIKELTTGDFKGGMSLTYEIHPKANWDNGTPITAHDYVFTIKALKNPKVHRRILRPYVDFIKKIEVDPSNPKKFTIFSAKKYFLAEEISGEYIPILPQYIYDPEGVMDKFTLEHFDKPKVAKKLKADPDLIKFTEEFEASKYEREPQYIVGAGPYELEEWQTGQQLVLVRKKKWWGDEVKNRETLKAYPNKIVYKIITDMDEAIEAFKNREVDILRSVKNNVFLEMQEDKQYNNSFFATPPQFAYYYIGFNTKKTHFADQKVRKAFAHLVDRAKILKEACNDIGVLVNSPINPTKSYYNKDIETVKYDIEEAKKLLTEAGWKDSNNNGVLDKKIKGKQVEFEVTYKYNQGNTIRKKIGLLLKEAAMQVGISVELEAVEWTVFLNDVSQRDFDLMCLAWVGSPGLDDLRLIWHTDADNNEGSNRVGFGSDRSDEIIEKLEETLEAEEQKKLYMEIQQIIHDDYPYIFLHSPNERVIMSKRIRNPSVSPLRPSYNPRSLKLKK